MHPDYDNVSRANRNQEGDADIGHSFLCRLRSFTIGTLERCMPYDIISNVERANGL